MVVHPVAAMASEAIGHALQGWIGNEIACTHGRGDSVATARDHVHNVRSYLKS